MWSGPKKRSARPAVAGFTLIEVLVAVLVAIVLGGSLVRFFAGVRSEAQRIEDTLAAWTVARTVLADVSGSAELAEGAKVGASGRYAWRVQMAPIADLGVAALAAAAAARDTSGEDFLSNERSSARETANQPEDSASGDDSGSDDGGPAVAWQPYRVRVEVTGPRGGSAQIETVRLGRMAAPADAAEGGL
jgi:type II secretory pathway pseudopilin PulG